MEAITMRRVQYKYPRGTVALDGINFKVKNGESIAILGPNGAGKSTLLHLMDALLFPTEGKVLIFGKDTRNSPDEIRRLVGLVFQDPDDQLFAPTVWEDVAFGPRNLGLSEKDIKERVEEAIRITGLEKHVKQPPHTLSYGQRKLAALAGVLAMKPKILLLDEPTASLDPRSASHIMRFVKDLQEKNNFTLVIATHDVDSIPLYARRILILDAGRVICDGTPSEIFCKVDMIRRCKLRLPRIGHLFEILNKKDGLFRNYYPLTIGEARKEIFNFAKALKER